MTVSVVIPNFNGKHLLEKNLPKILKAVGDAQVIIVDDGSTDGSVEFIKKNYPQITLLEKITNHGFATSTNLGFKVATGEIVISLNTDVIPKPDFLKSLLPHFKDEKVFAVGCLDKSFEGNKVVDRGRGVGKFLKGFLVHTRGDTNKTNTLWANGGSSAFRKKIWEQMGGMDELYNPFYWDDIDLSFRAWKSGYKIIFENKSVVEHYHQKGAIKQKYSSSQVKRIAYRNQFIFMWKNITDFSLLVNHLWWLPCHLCRALVRLDFSYIHGFVDALVKLRPIYQSRRIAGQRFITSDRQVLKTFADE